MALDLGKLEAICIENNYSLITEDPAKSLAESITQREKVRVINEDLDWIMDLKPDRRCYIKKDDNIYYKINLINW